MSAAYALVLAVLLLPAATLGDRLGRALSRRPLASVRSAVAKPSVEVSYTVHSRAVRVVQMRHNVSAALGWPCAAGRLASSSSMSSFGSCLLAASGVATLRAGMAPTIGSLTGC